MTQQPTIEYKVRIPAAQVDRFAELMESAGMKFHPNHDVINLSHVDYELDPGLPIFHGGDAGEIAAAVNAALEDQGATPLIPEGEENPGRTAQLLDLAGRWFSWRDKFRVDEFLGQYSNRPWPEIAAEYPLVFGGKERE